MRPSYRDAVLAVAVAVLAETEVLTGQVAGPRVPAALLAVPMTLSLLARRTHPLLSALAVDGAFVVNWAVGVDLYNYMATVIAGLVIAYSVAAHLPRRRAGMALACTYVAIAVSALRGPSGLLWGAVLVGGAGLAGFAIRDRRDHIQRLAELADELEQTRDEHARAAAADERARIARDLHDIVAHSVSVMVVQAGAAEQVLGTAAERARDPLTSIQDTGRLALVELRRLLHVLRADDSEPALAPQPGLSSLDALADDVRRAGIDVQVRVRGNPAAAPAGVDLAAYRIVQEALTNVIKHAAATRAEVLLEYQPTTLCIEVVDDGRRPSPGNHNGHGLIGMRERARLCGGSVEAEHRSGGGFAVLARLPLRAGV